MNKQIIPFLITDNDVKTEINKIKPKIINDEKNINQMLIPRYGTTVDLKTNKVSEQTDKYLTRDNIPKNNELIKKKYRISRIHIDSRYRNKDPQNIISNYITISKPFTFTKNSNVLKINMPLNHGLNINDYITISNVLPITITLRASSLSLKQNTTFLYINHSNHGFIGSNNIIRISGVQNADINNYFFGNIPLSIINTQHTIILIQSNGIIDYDNYYVDLGIYSNINFNYNETSFNIDILTLNGVNVSYINASYPISDEIYQGSQIISDIGSNYIKINLSVSANEMDDSSLIGNDNILIGVITFSNSGYANPDYYKFELKKTYYKVKKILLVSSEFPNSEMLIKNQPSNIKNNMLYWQIMNDGDYIYSISITPGNYDALNLQLELTKKISNIYRNFGSYLDTNLYYNSCIPNININPYNNIFSFQILSTITLSKNINLNTTINDDSHRRLNILHPYHNLNIGDIITISNAVNVVDDSGENLYIPQDIINNTQIIESITGINGYIIKIPKYNPTNNGGGYSNLINGGNAVSITFPLSVRLLFNTSDTIGDILGYKNVGEVTSITTFNKIITNKTMYINDSNLNSVGLINTNEPILNFTTYPYILTVSELFSSTINYRDSTGIFAKLFLTGNSGSMIYDQYVQILEYIPVVMSNLNELVFSFLTPSGDNYNFNGQDHSFTLEIYEELESD